MAVICKFNLHVGGNGKKHVTGANDPSFELTQHLRRSDNVLSPFVQEKKEDMASPTGFEPVLSA
jgi:hypothetical protein